MESVVRLSTSSAGPFDPNPNAHGAAAIEGSRETPRLADEAYSLAEGVTSYSGIL